MGEHPEAHELLALAERADDDAAPPARAAAHVAACPECREQLALYRGAARLVREAAPSSRAYCPSRAELSAEDLAPPRAAARARHLAACPLCAEDLADWRALEAAPAPSLLAPTLGGRVVLLLDAAARALRLLEASFPPLPSATPALVRGEAPAAASAAGVRAPFGEGALELSWTAAGAGVHLRARAAEGAPVPYRVELRDPDGAPLESRASDEAGVVSLSDLAPGAYRLLAYGPQRSEPELELELELRR